MFSEFSYIFKNTVFEKNSKLQPYSSITRKILKCDTESCRKNISKIPNVSFTFSNSDKEKIKTVKHFKKVHIDSEKPINSFKII